MIVTTIGTIFTLLFVVLFLLIIRYFVFITDKSTSNSLSHNVLSFLCASVILIFTASLAVYLSQKYENNLEKVHNTKILTVILGLVTYLLTQVYYGYSDWRNDLFDIELTKEGKQHKFVIQTCCAIITAAFGSWQFLDWNFMKKNNQSPILWLGYSFDAISIIVLIIVIFTVCRFRKIHGIYKIKNTEDNILDPSYWRKIWK